MLAIRDCADDGKLQGTYSHHALTRALKELPSDGDEYTDCANALLKALTGGSGSTLAPPANGIVTPSGAVAASPDDAAQLQTVIDAASAGQPVHVAAPAPVSAPATRRPAPASAAVLEPVRSPAPPYRPDLTLLAVVIGAGALLLGAAAALRTRPVA